MPYHAKLNGHDILNLTKKNAFLQLALSNQLVIRDFQAVSAKLDECFYDSVRLSNEDSNKTKVCGDTPMLARVDSSKIGASFCTIQGQNWKRGDSDLLFTVQELCGPLLYCVATESKGENVVHKFIGREPAPPKKKDKESILLDDKNRPYNPFTESGLIMSGALLLEDTFIQHKKGDDNQSRNSRIRDESAKKAVLPDSCDVIKQAWAKSIGLKSTDIGFSNCHFLSQRSKANKTISQGYFMNGHKSFPGGELGQSDLNEVLNFFFINSSVEMSCEHLSTFAATLATGGVCPTTNTRVFSSETVKSCLALMDSCGMGDFSGNLQFTIGYPCKSSKSGFTITVLPNLGGFCSFSPKIDELFNSNFGLLFLDNLVHMFPFKSLEGVHSFDNNINNTNVQFQYNNIGHGKIYNENSDNNDKSNLPNVESQINGCCVDNPARYYNFDVASRNECSNNHFQNDSDRSGRLEMLTASAQGSECIIRQLYARGCEVTLPDYDLRTPLHLAASNGHLNCVKVLCLFGAKIDANDRMGNTALDDAKNEGREDIIDFLLNVPNNAKSYSGSTIDYELKKMNLNVLIDGTPLVLNSSPPSSPKNSRSKDNVRFDSIDSLGKESLKLENGSTNITKEQKSFLNNNSKVLREANPELELPEKDNTISDDVKIFPKLSCDSGNFHSTKAKISTTSSDMSDDFQRRASIDLKLRALDLMNEITIKNRLYNSSSSSVGTRSMALSTVSKIDQGSTEEGHFANEFYDEVEEDNENSSIRAEQSISWLDSLKQCTLNPNNDEKNSENQLKFVERGATFGELVECVRRCGIYDTSFENAVHEMLRRDVSVNKDDLFDMKTQRQQTNIKKSSPIRRRNSEVTRVAEIFSSGNEISAVDLRQLASQYAFLPKTLEGRIIIRNFSKFTKDMKTIFQQVRKHTGGDVARYIPQLAKVNPDQFGLSICSIDAQKLSIGDSNVSFCVQSAMKPINYCIAQELIGERLVHEHVGYEPSGMNFNELTLNKNGLPHNPLINAGAIATASLILPEAGAADRFDYITSVWSKLTGGVKPKYSVETSLSERETADRNFCLGYLMKENQVFGSNVKTSNELEDVLEFYFSCCSLEFTCETLSIVAATLANGGINPVTQERCFKPSTVHNCLSLMSVAGMYDFSGEFQYSIGVPAKSGVSGALIIVIPNVMGICIWSPRLDSLGNSVRGIEFCKLLEQRYGIHRYSSLKGLSKRVDVRDWSNGFSVSRTTQKLIEAATRGDERSFKLILSECSNDVTKEVNRTDYDQRTCMHLCASEGRLKFIKQLHNLGANLNPVDRWGITPLKAAMSANRKSVVDYLKNNGAHLGEHED